MIILAFLIQAALSQTLFVHSSGHSTCRKVDNYVEEDQYSNRGTYHLEQLNKAKQGTTFIATCFFDNEDHLKLYRSDRPEQEYLVSYAEYVETVEGLYFEGGFNSLSISGYSHGGWLAMHLGAKISRFVNVGWMYTIDPISRKRCNWKYLNWKGFKSQWFWPFDCWRYPKDFKILEIKKIRNTAKEWVHVYQKRSRWLHSSFMPFATFNMQVSLFHTQLHHSDEVWSVIFKHLEEN